LIARLSRERIASCGAREAPNILLSIASQIYLRLLNQLRAISVYWPTLDEVAVGILHVATPFPAAIV